jgi:hypothetical protein
MRTRRQFNKQALTAITSFALVESLFAFNAFSPVIGTEMALWLKRLNTYCRDLKKESLTGEEWQELVGGLFDQVSLTALLQFIDFDHLIKGFKYPDLGVSTRPVNFPRLAGLPEDIVFTKKIFGMQKDRAVVPHGHSNMSSAHLILAGELHLRHYDKIMSEKNRLIIKPTVDQMVCPGDHSSISNEKDNIHWFIANSDVAFTLDVIMLDLAGKPYDIHNLDMDKGEKLSDGTLRVPVLDVQEALVKYGKNSHH